jgi:hypothetical protein
MEESANGRADLNGMCAASCTAQPWNLIGNGGP